MTLQKIITGLDELTWSVFLLVYMCYIKTMTREQAKQLDDQFKQERRLHLLVAKLEPNKFKRFLKIVWHYSSFPFIWIWRNLKDWRTIVIFIFVFLIVSCEVWIPYLIAFIVGLDTTLGKSMIGVGTACWSFWLLPATPFLPICILITMAVKAVFNKIRFRNK